MQIKKLILKTNYTTIKIKNNTKTGLITAIIKIIKIILKMRNFSQLCSYIKIRIEKKSFVIIL